MVITNQVEPPIGASARSGMMVSVWCGGNMYFDATARRLASPNSPRAAGVIVARDDEQLFVSALADLREKKLGLIFGGSGGVRQTHKELVVIALPFRPIHGQIALRLTVHVARAAHQGDGRDSRANKIPTLCDAPSVGVAGEDNDCIATVG